ncbi:MAG: ribosomal protein S18-alanine N-acetyltransferase [Clostridia bacterium]|nr:ribosomal protein S18-alanine N-acetyltransferase [Clostridia bacterium]
MRVLFVCSGNTCRSPMAEGYLNSKNLSGVKALSAGFICAGEHAARSAVSVMNEIGIDISAHISRLITADALLSDKIFCMGENHKSALLGAGVPEEKIRVLSGGIEDPYGKSTQVYRECRNQIISGIDTALYSGKILPIKILTAGKEDVKDIQELESECFSAPWSQKAIIEALEHNTVFFKAMVDDKTVGYIGVTAVAGEAYVNNIAVKSDYRKRGIGSVLLDRAVTYARDKTLEFLSLEVRKSNTAAISLYTKAGFQQEGIRKSFYDNPCEDGIIMTRRFKI